MPYYEGNVKYFGTEHLPFAVLAIAVLLVFNFLPILLFCLYPCRWALRCLNSCYLRHQALHTFMDALTSKAVIRMALMVTEIISLLILIFLVVCYRPYKHASCNNLDIFFLLNTSAQIVSGFTFEHDESFPGFMVNRCVLTFAIFVPAMYSLWLLLYYIRKKLTTLQLNGEANQILFHNR